MLSDFSERYSADTIRADCERFLVAVDPIVIAEAYCSTCGCGHIEAISICDFVDWSVGLRERILVSTRRMVWATLGTMQSAIETRRLRKTG